MSLSGTGTILIFLSAVTTCIAMILHAVAFTMRQWLKSVAPSPFISIGFHEGCFDNCRFPYCPAGDQFVYHGCWWLFDHEYFRELQDWLVPPWFYFIRDLAIANVPLSVVSFAGAAVTSCLVGIWRYPRTKTPLREIVLQILLLLTGLATAACAVLTIVILASFYMNCFRLDWLPFPEKNRLGHSYWMEFVVAILELMAFAMIAVAAFSKTVRTKVPKNPRVAEDMMLGEI